MRNLLFSCLYEADLVINISQWQAGIKAQIKNLNLKRGELLAPYAYKLF
jgi:hypothetical protein